MKKVFAYLLFAGLVNCSSFENVFSGLADGLLPTRGDGSSSILYAAGTYTSQMALVVLAAKNLELSPKGFLAFIALSYGTWNLLSD